MKVVQIVVVHLIIALLAAFSAGEITLEPVRPKAYFFVEGQELSMTCIANNLPLDSNSSYTFEWKKRGGTVYANGTANVKMIVKNLEGSSLMSTLTLMNSASIPSGRYMIVCRFMEDDAYTGSFKSFEFRPTLLKNLPNVTVSSSSVAMDYGETATLSCVVRGDLPASVFPLSMKWAKDGLDLKTDKQPTNGAAVVFNYTINMANGSSGGVYMCQGFNIVKQKLQDNATVTVSVSPKLLGEAANMEYVTPGNDAMLTCDIDGYPLHITWQKKTDDGSLQDLPSNNRYKLENNKKVLKISPYQSEDDGEFVCKTKSKDNKDIIQTTTLTTKVLPNIKEEDKSKKVVLIPGKPTNLTCAISGVPAPCVTWRVYEPGSKTARDVASITGVSQPAKCQATLELRNLSSIITGHVFQCTFEDDYTQSFAMAKMTKPHRSGDKRKEVKSEEGDDITLKCDIDVFPVEIQWFVGKRLVNVSTSKYKINAADARKFSVLDIEKSDRGSFFCVAKNALLMVGVRQEIVLRVKNGMDWLWPVVGTLIVIVVVALIIGLTTYRRKCKNRANKRAQETQDAKELQDATGTHVEDGAQATTMLLDK